MVATTAAVRGRTASVVRRHRTAAAIRRCTRARSAAVRRPAVASTIAGRSTIAAAGGRRTISTAIARRAAVVSTRRGRTGSAVLIAAHPAVVARRTNRTRGPRNACAREIARSAHPGTASGADVGAVAPAEVRRRSRDGALRISERRSLMCRRGRESATRFTGAATHRRTRYVARDLRIAHSITRHRALRHTRRGPGNFTVAHRAVHRAASRSVRLADSAGERLVPCVSLTLIEAPRRGRLAEAVRRGVERWPHRGMRRHGCGPASIRAGDCTAGW